MQSASDAPPRALVIAEAANPEWVSVPLVGWSHAAALLRHSDAHLVTHVRNAAAIERTGLARERFTAIDSERVAAPLYKLGTLLRGGSNRAWSTAAVFSTLSYYYFEHLVWRRFRAALRAGEYDVVHRVTPLSPATPSLLARRCRRIGVPFVVGPLNGGVPWPRAYAAERRREGEWLNALRGLHRLMPGSRSMRRDAAALIVGSRTTLAEIPETYRDKCVYCVENAVDPGRFAVPRARPAGRPLRVVFVGRLVPLKCVDVLLEAVAPAVRDGRIVVDVFGDGPERPALERLVAELGIGAGARLRGWVQHEDLPAELVQADVLAFPSIREFGGGVVLEAMALGLAPVVVDYGGPAELVDDSTGVRVPLAERASLVAAFRTALEALAAEPVRADELGARARERVLAEFTWDAKAQRTLEVYRWVTGRRESRP